MSTGSFPEGGVAPNVRLRRLKSDHERIVSNLEGQKRVKLVKTFGSPPEKYQLEYLVRSLEKSERGVRERTTHQVEITLTRAYPRMAPQCRMLTPVFHPNIAPHAICIGDHWAASETLASLIVRIGEMLSFQSYNLKSPLNGEAARWVEANQAKLPLERHDFSALLERGDRVAASVEAGGGGGRGAGSTGGDGGSGSGLRSGAGAGRVGAGAAGSPAIDEPCANCGKRFPRESLQVCGARHLSCPDCIVPCGSCDRIVCLRCRTEPCADCGALACLDCLAVCPGCKKRTCPRHRSACGVCGHAHCSDCSIECLRCKKPTCTAHVVPLKGRDGCVCKTCADTLRAKRAAGGTPGAQGGTEPPSA